MKFITFFLIIMTLNGCNIKYNDNESVRCENICIKPFNSNIDNFCYYFLPNCASCQAIESKIALKEKEMCNFFIIEVNWSYLKGIYKNDSLNVKSHEAMRFVGFPTLVKIVKNEVREIYVGISEIVSALY